MIYQYGIWLIDQSRAFIRVFYVANHFTDKLGLRSMVPKGFQGTLAFLPSLVQKFLLLLLSFSPSPVNFVVMGKFCQKRVCCGALWLWSMEVHSTASHCHCRAICLWLPHGVVNCIVPEEHSYLGEWWMKRSHWCSWVLTCWWLWWSGQKPWTINSSRLGVSGSISA